MIQWIVFDAMGVIYTVSDDVNDLLFPFCKRALPSLTKETFIDIYMKVYIGQISCKSFWDGIGLGNQYPQIEHEYLYTMLSMDKEFPNAALTLQKHYKLGLLSNDVGDWSRTLRKRFNIDFFDTAVVSGDELCRKPQKKIFELFLERSGARGEECVFIDDRKVNLKVAHDFGFKTIWFNKIEDDFIYKPDAEIHSFSMMLTTIKSML